MGVIAAERRRFDTAARELLRFVADRLDQVEVRAGASRIGEHPGIVVDERRPAQLRLASPHPDRSKAFRRAVVTLGHSMS